MKINIMQKVVRGRKVLLIDTIGAKYVTQSL